MGKRTDCARCNLSAATGGLEIGIFDVSTMYEKVKNVAKKVLPKRFIDRNEGFLRKLVAITYRGSEYECAICGFHMSKFVVLDNGNKLCPRCGSLPRTRRLFTVLNSEIGIQNKSILHFSPPVSIAERIRKEKERIEREKEEREKDQQRLIQKAKEEQYIIDPNARVYKIQIGDSFTIGPDDARVTIIHWSDFQ